MNVKRWSVIAGILLFAEPLRAEIAPPAVEPIYLAALWPAAQPPQTPHPAVVRVIATDRNSMSLGSGTLVDANDDYGLVISNWHVVRDAVGPIEVVFPDGFHSMARVVRTDREWDLAALLIWKPPVQPVMVTSAAPRPGEILTIAGYGHGDYKAQSGACTQYLSPAPGRPLEIVEVAAAARHGDSGGPMFNSRGELAGVLFGEGGGRTDGSYGGRVYKFLELAANDLRKLPPTNTNIAKNSSSPAAPAMPASISPPAARFEGGLAASAADQPGASGWNSAPDDRLANRPLYGPSPGAVPAGRALAISGEVAPSVGAAKLRNLAKTNFIWGDELKSFLAAFGIAAILLNAMRWVGGR
jgi:hypothetical protein